MWGPVATEESLLKNDCGNPLIDNLARVRAMQDVWFRLAYLFPACQALNASIWMCRRNGEIAQALKGTGLDECKYGPRNKREWELLAKICVEAALKRAIPKEWIYEYLTPTKLQELAKADTLGKGEGLG